MNKNPENKIIESLIFNFFNIFINANNAINPPITDTNLPVNTEVPNNLNTIESNGIDPEKTIPLPKSIP